MVTERFIPERTNPAKAEGISRITYPALSLYVDKSACADIDRMLFDFLWKQKKRDYTHATKETLKITVV